VTATVLRRRAAQFRVSALAELEPARPALLPTAGTVRVLPRQDEAAVDVVPLRAHRGADQLHAVVKSAAFAGGELSR
jgi:hypothetical protein